MVSVVNSLCWVDYREECSQTQKGISGSRPSCLAREIWSQSD
jgi:hypothetical protein